MTHDLSQRILLAIGTSIPLLGIDQFMAHILQISPLLRSQPYWQHSQESSYSSAEPCQSSKTKTLSSCRAPCQKPFTCTPGPSNASSSESKPIQYAQDAEGPSSPHTTGTGNTPVSPLAGAIIGVLAVGSIIAATVVTWEEIWKGKTLR